MVGFVWLEGLVSSGWSGSFRWFCFLGVGWFGLLASFGFWFVRLIWVWSVGLVGFAQSVSIGRNRALGWDEFDCLVAFVWVVLFDR